MGLEKLKTGFGKTKKVRRAWSLYKWFNRLRNWQDYYAWISSFLQTKAGLAVALGATAAATTGAIVTHNAVVDPYSAPYEQVVTPPLVVAEAPPPPPPPPPPPEPAPEPVRQTQSTLIFAIEGHDKAGKRGTFDVVVAKKEFLWVRGSAEELEKAGRVITGAELQAEVLDQEVRRALEQAREVIAVGTASQEGDAREETERAKRRALKTAELIRSGIPGELSISALNLGQYREPCQTCEAGGTNWQRPFMVIAVKDLEDGAVLGEALADAMTGKAKLPSPKSYSAFELIKVR